MMRWEYRTVRLETRINGMGKGTELREPGTHHTIEQALEGLGQEGWELAGVLPPANLGAVLTDARLIFKRPLPDAAPQP